MLEAPDTLLVYDATLREGAQMKGVKLSIEDKVRICELLDAFGVHYVEGGWPGAVTNDAEFFAAMGRRTLRHTRLVAFGSTRRHDRRAQDDPQLDALLRAETPVITLVAKSSPSHVERFLKVERGANLDMIADSVAYLRAEGREVWLDAEHFYDGMAEDADYPLQCLQAAVAAGAAGVVLCDTNGGALPADVARLTAAACAAVAAPVGAHMHDDCGLAVANSLAAVEAGARMLQGTVNGYGERCGNANLMSLLPLLQFKLGRACLPAETFAGLRKLALNVAAIVNLPPNPQAPFVGSSAYTHKAGLHVSALRTDPASYEHLDPAAVGATRQVPISAQSGKSNLRWRAGELGLTLADPDAVLQQVKQLEGRGIHLEEADGTAELLLRRGAVGYAPPFTVLDLTAHSTLHGESWHPCRVTGKVEVAGTPLLTVAEAAGPVEAIDRALRRALEPAFPELAAMQLTDFKVRLVNPAAATAATTHVWLEAGHGTARWSTVGSSANVLDASCQALGDAFEVFLLRRAAEERCEADPAPAAGAARAHG